MNSLNCFRLQMIRLAISVFLVLTSWLMTRAIEPDLLRQLSTPITSQLSGS